MDHLISDTESCATDAARCMPDSNTFFFFFFTDILSHLIVHTAMQDNFLSCSFS